MIGSVFERRSTTNTDVPLCSHQSCFTPDTVRTVATVYAILNGVPDRGEIVWLEFDPQAGREQAGRRPAVVLSPASYNAPTGRALCVPVATMAKGYPSTWRSLPTARCRVWRGTRRWCSAMSD